MSIIQKIATPPALDAKAVITQFKVQRIDESSGFILALPKRVAIGQAPTITMIIGRIISLSSTPR